MPLQDCDRSSTYDARTTAACPELHEGDVAAVFSRCTNHSRYSAFSHKNNASPTTVCTAFDRLDHKGRRARWRPVNCAKIFRALQLIKARHSEGATPMPRDIAGFAKDSDREGQRHEVENADLDACNVADLPSSCHSGGLFGTSIGVGSRCDCFTSDPHRSCWHSRRGILGTF